MTCPDSSVNSLTNLTSGHSSLMQKLTPLSLLFAKYVCHIIIKQLVCTRIQVPSSKLYLVICRGGDKKQASAYFYSDSEDEVPPE